MNQMYEILFKIFPQFRWILFLSCDILLKNVFLQIYYELGV